LQNPAKKNKEIIIYYFDIFIIKKYFYINIIYCITSIKFEKN